MAQLLLQAAFLAVLWQGTLGKRQDEGALGMLQAEEKASEGNELCLDCDKFPKAEDYEDDWRKPGSLQRAFESYNKISNSSVDADPQQVVEMLQLAAQAIFDLVQGQGCLSACAICSPSSQSMTAHDFKFKSVFIHRTKGILDKFLWAPALPLDAAAGGVVGLLAPLLPGVIVATGAGLIGGAAAGGFVGNQTSKVPVPFSSLAGLILGLAAGISTGALASVSVVALVELVGLFIGMWKGVGLTSLITDCDRVGFVDSAGGVKAPNQTFATDFLSTYGLEKLRHWNDRAELPNDIDQLATKHCEHLRKHNFDMRHLSQCVTHSQLCGEAGAMMTLPLPQDVCRSLSSPDILEQIAQKAGDDPETGFFAKWREMQGALGQSRSKCIELLCKHGGFRKASVNFHPDKMVNSALSEAERNELIDTMKVLSDCKGNFQDDDGNELTLSSAASRKAHCL